MLRVNSLTKMDNKTLVYLDPETANKFILFQKHYVPFTLLCDSKVFDQKAATIVIKINKDGVIKSIIRTDLLYSDIPNFVFINDNA